MEKLRSKATDKLFKAILSLESVDECYDFFEDICTIKELRDLSLRLEVAAMLRSGMSYQEVTKKTGVSAATICRVNKCLTYGTGYQSVLKKSEEETKSK
ncbi:MAG: hypothetical protein IJ303_01520 [Clostridia bacterium]|nr:hypothetical protein [Clostridia bacterium]